MSNVVLSSAPFLSPKRLPVPHGVSISNIVEYVYNDRGIPGICRLNDLIVEVDGMPVPKENWNIIPREEAHVMVYMPVRGGGGGKNPLRTLLTIAVVFAAVAIPGGLAAFAAGGGLGFGAIGVGTAAFASSAIGAALISGAVMTAGMMLVNALAPVRPPSIAPRGEYKDSPAYSISGARNQMTPYGPVPVILGTHRFFPPLAAKPYTEIVGDDEYIRLLFAWVGPCKIEDLKIGDTPIASYDGFDGTDTNSNLELREGWSTDAPITIYPSIVDQTTVNVELTNAGGWVDRTVAVGYDEIVVDISFPRGLVKFDNSGNRQEQTVVVRARYREVGAPDWIYLDESFSYLAVERSATIEPFSYGVWSVYADTSGEISFHQGSAERDSSVRLGYFTADNNGEFDTLTGATNLTVAGRTGLSLSIDIRTGNEYVLMVSLGSVLFGISSLSVTAKTPTLIRRTVGGRFDRAKTYEIGLLRDSADTDSDQIMDSVYWSNIKAITKDAPLNFSIPMAQIAIRLKASEGIQNQVDVINCLAKSYAPRYVSGAWEAAASKDTPTNNPAALYRHVLMHPANHKARVAAQINDSELGTWYTTCATNGYAFNQVRDFVSSVWDTLADIAFAGRAAPSLAYGVWGVDYDGGSRQVDAHVTPRNSWGFKAEKMLMDRPHGFRVLFNNEDKDYLEDERIVYDDGYSSANATIIERLEFKGITDPDLIWKFARFHIAQARLRPEIYSLLMDFENLTFKRNSLVMVSHDVPRWGDYWGRVKSLTTVSTNTTGVVLDEVVLMELGNTYACRFRLADGTSSVISVTNVPGETDTIVFATPVPTATGPQVGDLAMFNESDSTAVELICTGLRRQGDMVAEVTFVDHAPAIYTADTGSIPAFTSQITGRLNPLALPAPIIDSVVGNLYAEDTVSAEIKRKIVVVGRIPATEFNLTTTEIIIRTRLKDANEPWQYTRFKNSPYEISVPVDGTYEVQGRYTAFVKDLSRFFSPTGVSESAWSGISEVVISSVTVLGLPDPTDITGFYELDSQGRVSKVKIRTRVDLSGATPTAVALMFSIQQTPRQVAVTDSGTYLTVNSVEVLNSGSNTILAGSTTTNIIIATAADPLPDLNLSGFYWGAIDTAGYRKATGSTSTAIQFADPFDNSPTPGNSLEWVEIAWADERADDYRLLNLISATGTTEVVKWTTVTEVSNEYRIGGLTRAQEGTTQVVGVTAQYYPAPGAGTTTITIPASSFVSLGGNVFEGSADVSIDIPAGSWGAATLATYVLSGMRVLRSNIVPITNWSPL